MKLISKMFLEVAAVKEKAGCYRDAYQFYWKAALEMNKLVEEFGHKVKPYKSKKVRLG